MNLLSAIEKRVLPMRVRRVLHRGSARYCPVCETEVERFRRFGWPARKDAQCPVCFSLERHRMILTYLRDRTDLFDGTPRRLLHVAPEPQLASIFRRLPGINYVSVDLEKGKAMVCADVTSLPFRDGEFDIVYCSHVLEHVPEDRKAMAEFRRVLRPGGWAILQVPLRGKVTDEDPSVTCPKERHRRFGQWDHVRIYGADYVDRLSAAGFQVTVDSFAQSIPATEAARMSIDRGEDVFLCK